MANNCAHNRGTFTSSLTESMWGSTFGRFCEQCGACLSHPDVPDRPKQAERTRSLGLPESTEPLSEEETEELAKCLATKLEKWIGPDGPFRKGLTYRG